MVALSNKTLALLLVVAMAVSVFGTVTTLNRLDNIGTASGRATTTDTSGQAQIEITSTLSVTFNQAVLNFGTGYINGSAVACPFGTNGTGPNNTFCVGFNNTINATNLTIENDGNLVANLSINFSSGNQTFLGGTSPLMLYRVTDFSRGSDSGNGACTGGVERNGSSTLGAPANADFTDALNGTDMRICDNFDFDNSDDVIMIELFLNIPADALQGSRTSTITAIACDDATC